MAKNDSEERDLSVEEEANDAEARIYELAFHIDAELPQEEAKKTYEAIKGLISGRIIAEGMPEKIQLAYTVSRMEHAGRRDFDSSYFAWIAYEAEGPVHQKILEGIRADSRVFRFLDIRTTEEEAKHSAEVAEMRLQMGEKQGAEEEVSDTELDAALKEVGV